MKTVVNESDIRKVIEESDELMSYIKNPFTIQLYHESDNIIFRIKGVNDVFAKVELTGWGKYEFETLSILSTKKYNVPKPITYIPFQQSVVEDLNFGKLDREVGVLFYLPLRGKSLKQELIKINILSGLEFLKRLHEDRSLINGKIKDYQKIEVERGLKYIDKLFEGNFADYLQNIIISYKNLEIDYCFIHGGPRLEHFIIKDDQIWMIDFEGACTGDLFKDLGIYLSELSYDNTNINKEELIDAYFKRKLNKSEEFRLNFFELRALMVKMNFIPSNTVLNSIKRLANYS